jgi:catechol 2,3-dioxygenase-like lactoylglutathione lyase family enzyme
MIIKKTMLLLITFSFFGMVKAQDINFTFNHIALSVKSLDKSALFYKEVMQLQEITNKTKIEGIRWFALGEGKELHLVSILKEPVTINKAVHFALTTSNFDRCIKNLNTNKITYSDWPGTPNKITIRSDGIKQIYFQDPDGYWIEVNSVGNRH